MFHGWVLPFGDAQINNMWTVEEIGFLYEWLYFGY